MLYVREALSVQVCKGTGKGGGDLSSRYWAFFTILDSRVCTGKWVFSVRMSGGRGSCKISSKTMKDVSIAELTWMLAEGLGIWAANSVLCSLLLATHHLLCRCRLDHRPADGPPVMPFQNSLFS